MGVALVVASIAALAIWLPGCGGGGSPPAGAISVGLGGESATWSRDGELIAAPGRGKIQLIDSNGSVGRLLRARGVRPSIWPCECRLGWSRDGRRILFLTPGSADRTAIVGTIGLGGVLRREPLPAPVGSATWSPQGWPMVFVPRSGVYGPDAARSNPEPDLWRLDALHAEPYKILAPQGTEINPQFSPDGTKILYARKHKGLRNVWVVNADGSNPRQLTRRLWLSAAAWSPDGKRVAVAGSSQSGQHLYVASVAGRGSRRLAGAENPTKGLAWTPDGRWITYADFDGKIWRIRPDSRGRETIGAIPDREVRRLLWSPNGRHLAYAARNVEDERYD